MAAAVVAVVATFPSILTAPGNPWTDPAAAEAEEAVVVVGAEGVAEGVVGAEGVAEGVVGVEEEVEEVGVEA